MLAQVALQPLDDDDDDDETPEEEEEVTSSQEKFLESRSHPANSVLVQPAFVKLAEKPQQGFPPFLQTNVYPEQLHSGSAELDAQVGLQPLDEEEEEEELEIIQMPVSTHVLPRIHPGLDGVFAVQHACEFGGQPYE